MGPVSFTSKWHINCILHWTRFHNCEARNSTVKYFWERLIFLVQPKCLTISESWVCQCELELSQELPSLLDHKVFVSKITANTRYPWELLAMWEPLETLCPVTQAQVPRPSQAPRLPQACVMLHHSALLPPFLLENPTLVQHLSHAALLQCHSHRPPYFLQFGIAGWSTSVPSLPHLPTPTTHQLHQALGAGHSLWERRSSLSSSWSDLPLPFHNFISIYIHTIQSTLAGLFFNHWASRRVSHSGFSLVAWCRPIIPSRASSSLREIPLDQGHGSQLCFWSVTHVSKGSRGGKSAGLGDKSSVF